MVDGTEQQDGFRRCRRCTARLARDNHHLVCSACSTDLVARPPLVPAGFWAHPVMRTALDTWHMGRVIYAYRTHPHHGRVVSQGLVAGWLNMTQAQLSRIEHASRPPEELSKLTHWATVLGIPPGLLWFKLPSARSQKAPAPPPGLGAVVPGELAGDLLGGLVSGRLPLQRSEAIGAALSGYEGLSLGQTASQVLRLFLYLDAQLGGDTLYAPLSQYVERMASIVAADPGDGLSGFGQLAQMAGWLAIDGNRHSAARRLLTTAVYAGHEADDPGLAASAMAYMSLHATYRGAPKAALSLAKAARATNTDALSPLTRTMLATREARAHAGMGDAGACLRTLDEMRTAFAQVGGVEEPVWLSYVDPVEVAAQEGACYLTLGMAAQARAALTRALDVLDRSESHRARDRVHYLSRLAKCHLLTGDVDAACAVATHALTLSAVIGSARVTERLGEFRTALAPYASSRPAREFEERYRTTSASTAP